MRIQTAAIMGAGAVGSYIYWGLTDQLGDDLWLISQGERAERLRRDGLIINGQQYKPVVRTPGEAHGVDLLIVSLKYTALTEAALDEIAEIVDDHTTIISVMNGINSEEIIGDRVGHGHMIYSIIKISAQRKNG
ncbi:MAG: ketopantoate reductase family protein, partial [Lachnospiraceae bacterium]|nr:ketopantoate reductase family protein [Lachnospiraceae bacterium]